jgi:hypothetical protein
MADRFLLAQVWELMILYAGSDSARLRAAFRKEN